VQNHQLLAYKPASPGQPERIPTVERRGSAARLAAFLVTLSSLTPEHGGKLLALGADGEPLGIANWRKAKSTKCHNGAAFDGGAGDLLLAGVVGVAIALPGVGLTRCWLRLG
jgi:hypothetical protein